ncbi:hypothetical protein MPLA_1730004 [Mesorhizobium sp. ORS 3359]|nr:hypothetical protein MPLA_1730004 [Mesorhizobium sp. ORS 3359]
MVWLQTLSDHWMATTLLNRTRIIDRFLDHLLNIEAIERNPVTALCEAYNIKQCRPVWRALAQQRIQIHLAARMVLAVGSVPAVESRVAEFMTVSR